MSKENLNKYIKHKLNQLLESEFTFEKLFEIIHDQEDRIFSESPTVFETDVITYKELSDYVYKFATYLSDKIDEPKNSFIGIYMENSINWISAFWAILMLGYRPLLINCRLPNPINRDVISMAECKQFVTDADFIDLGIKSIDIEKTLYRIKEIEQCEPYTPSTWGNEFALSSTATTLNVKLCVYNGENITYQILNTEKIVSVNKMIKTTYKGSIKLLMFLPLYHVFGLIASYFWFSFFGRSFVFLKDYAPNTITYTIRKHKVTHIFAVPLLWNSLVKEINKEVSKLDEKTQKKYQKGLNISYRLQRIFPNLSLKFTKKMFSRIQDKTFGDSVRFMISGGSYLPYDTLRTLNLIGYPLYVGYGASEIGITSVELRKNIKDRLSNSIGKPFTNVTYVIDDDILKVKSLSMSSKIITKDDVITNDENSFFVTNDIVNVDKNKNYFILGRKDDVFVGINGEKINPDIIERDLTLVNINRYCVLDVPIDNKPCLSLVLEVSKDLNSIRLAQIIEEVTKLSEYIKVKQYPINNIYYTFNSIANANAIKVSRKALRKMIDERSVKLHKINELSISDDKEEINNEISLEIRKIISQLLNIEEDKIKNNSNFIIDLGGTSLDYCQLVIEIETAFNIKIELGDEPILTIGEFTKYIMNNQGGTQ